jgi:hypothetical protein
MIDLFHSFRIPHPAFLESYGTSYHRCDIPRKTDGRLSLSTGAGFWHNAKLVVDYHSG